MKRFTTVIAFFIISINSGLAQEVDDDLAEAYYYLFSEGAEENDDPIIGKWEPIMQVSYEDTVEYDRHVPTECERRNWLQFSSDGVVTMGGFHGEVDGDCTPLEDEWLDPYAHLEREDRWKKIKGSKYTILLADREDEYIEKILSVEFTSDKEMILTSYWDSDDLEANYDVITYRRIK